MAFALPDRARPMSDLNTTPLIDILLVLLVMLIFTLPPATNTFSLPLPQPGPSRPIDSVRNVVSVTASDAILWNDEPVSETELETLLRDAATLEPEPEIDLSPDGRAGYKKAARVLRLVRLSGASRVGFVGNEKHRAFAS